MTDEKSIRAFLALDPPEALRLWLRDEITLLLGEIAGLQRALVSLGEKNADVIIPGNTLGKLLKRNNMK